MHAKFLGALLAASTVALAAPAGAVSIMVDTFSAASYATKVSALGAIVAQEDFESLAAGEQSGSLSTGVGAFVTLGGVGGGQTVSGTPGNTGTGLYLRDAPVFGRTNTTAGGSNFLDSNDTLGMSWTVSGLGQFNSLLFNLSDVGDSGGDLSVSAGGSVLDTILRGRAGSLIDTVLISFDSLVDEATITLRKSKLDDGFGIDDVVVASDVAPVPLPAAGWLLLAGVGALFASARRRVA